MPGKRKASAAKPKNTQNEFLDAKNRVETFNNNIHAFQAGVHYHLKTFPSRIINVDKKLMISEQLLSIIKDTIISFNELTHNDFKFELHQKMTFRMVFCIYSALHTNARSFFEKNKKTYSFAYNKEHCLTSTCTEHCHHYSQLFCSVASFFESDSEATEEEKQNDVETPPFSEISVPSHDGQVVFVGYGKTYRLRIEPKQTIASRIGEISLALEVGEMKLIRHAAIGERSANDGNEPSNQNDLKEKTEAEASEMTTLEPTGIVTSRTCQNCIPTKKNLERDEINLERVHANIMEVKGKMESATMARDNLSQKAKMNEEEVKKLDEVQKVYNQQLETIQFYENKLTDMEAATKLDEINFLKLQIHKMEVLLADRNQQKQVTEKRNAEITEKTFQLKLMQEEILGFPSELCSINTEVEDLNLQLESLKAKNALLSEKLERFRRN